MSFKFRHNVLLQERLGILLVLCISFIMLSRGFLGPMWYAEIDSNTLPTIALQYRGSLSVNQSDIEQAKVDFPDLHKEINGFNDLRSAKLIMISDNEWLPYYCPIYPLLCIPVKMLFQVLHIDQQRCFFVTNALLVAAALLFLQLTLKVSPLLRMAAVLMLTISPIIYYINYLNYEAYMYSMLVVALVLYANKHRNWSAFFLSLAAISNSTMAAIGLVMIAEYGIGILRHLRQCSVSMIVKQYWRETLQYAICFLPCFFPFIYQIYFLGNDVFSGGATTEQYWARFLTYLFDPTLGFTLFAPIALILFFIIAIICVVVKQCQAITWVAMLMAVVGAYSLMFHINCGMLFCARYVVWSYPIIPIFLVKFSPSCIKNKAMLYFLHGASIVSTAVLMIINPLQSSYDYSTTSKWLLKYMPSIYHQYSATFYCRTLHIDGAYDYTEPAYYGDELTGQIYKLIYKADEGEAEKVYSDLKGNATAMNYLRQELDKNGLDGDFHYINFPSWGQYTVYQKSSIELYGLTARETLVEAKDFTLQKGDTYNYYSSNITIRPNTFYQIKLVLPDDFKASEYSSLFIDFYGGEEYDSPDQERDAFIYQGRSDYSFEFNSGEFKEETKKVAVRIITNEGTPVSIKYFSVVEFA